MAHDSYSLGASHTEQERLIEQRLLYGDTREIHFERTDKVCEFGCGPLSNYWIPQALPEGRYAGVDIQAAHISEAKRRAAELGLSNTEFVLADGASTKIADNSFDVVFARCVLIHLKQPQPLLNEMLRVLRPGGRVILIEPHDPTYYVTPNKPNLLKVYRARDRFAYFDGRGTPDAALNLYTYLVQLGAGNVSIKPHVIYATGSDPERCLSLMRNWLKLTEPVISALIAEERVSAEEWELARQEAAQAAPETFLYQSMWIAQGTKC